MDDLILLACLVGPAVVTFALRKTRVCWLPGVVLAVVGVAMLGSISPAHGDDSVVGVWGPIGDAIEGVFFLVYGLLCLVVALVSHRPAIRTPEVPTPVEAPPIGEAPPSVEIPPAVVVSEAPKI